jgi:sulfur transfer protein SufE
MLQVWVVPELRDDGKIYWTADSDSQLTKGLAALLVLGLSGCSPAEILSLQPGFIEMLGLKQSLTPSRNNGFLNMFLKMQKLTLGLVVSAAEDHLHGVNTAAVARDSAVLIALR